MGRKGFTLGEVDRAIVANDYEALDDLFRYVDLTDHAARAPLTSVTYKLVYEALGCAASTAHSGRLHDRTAVFLINRAYSCMNVFSVATSAALALGCYGANYDPGIIPENIRHACTHKEYNEEVSTAFGEMSEEQFKALLAFLSSNKVSTIDRGFSYSILAYMYLHGTVDTSTLLFIMASTLDEPSKGPGMKDAFMLGMLV